MQVSAIARAVLEPLCEKTAKILKPTTLAPNDRLEVRLNADGTKFIVSAYALLGETRVGASGGARTGWTLFVPGRKELDYGVWAIPATDTSAILIEANWPREQIHFDPQAEQLYLFLLTRFMSQTIFSYMRADFSINGKAPEPTDDEHPRFPAAPHQRVAFATSLNAEAAGYWMEQGTGKTYPAIMRIMAEAKNCDRMYRAIVVCPKNIRKNWELEVERFATQPGKITVLRGGHLNRMKLLIDAMRLEEDCKYSIVVVGYETLVNSIDILGEISWDLGIADESHAFKWHRTKRWEKMKVLRDACRQRMGLTGTPYCNNLFDAWTQLEWLGEGLSGFDSYKAFKEFYGVFTRDGEQTGYDNLPLLKERLARLTFQVKKKDVLKDLPEKQFQTVEIELTPEQMKAYAALQDELLLEIEQEQTTRTVSASNILVKLLRLTQVTSGFLAFDAQVDADGNPINDREVKHFSPNPKIEQLKEDAAELGEKSKGIVWCNNPCVIEEILKVLPGAVPYYGAISEAKREEAVWRFNNDDSCRWFVANPACCKEGLTLLGYNPDDDRGYNCDTVIRFNRDWSMTKYLQSNDRCHRRGTRVPIVYREYTVLDSIDEEISVRLAQKELNANAWADVKEIMERVLKVALVRDE